jgi:hypothetical protein
MLPSASFTPGKVARAALNSDCPSVAPPVTDASSSPSLQPEPVREAPLRSRGGSSSREPGSPGWLDTKADTLHIQMRGRADKRPFFDLLLLLITELRAQTLSRTALDASTIIVKLGGLIGL